jgi:hypothetical protein
LRYIAERTAMSEKEIKDWGKRFQNPMAEVIAFQLIHIRYNI